MELSFPPPHTSGEHEKRRLIAAALFEQDELSQAQIARVLHVSRQAVHKWHKA